LLSEERLNRSLCSGFIFSLVRLKFVQVFSRRNLGRSIENATQGKYDK